MYISYSIQLLAIRSWIASCINKRYIYTFIAIFIKLWWLTVCNILRWYQWTLLVLMEIVNYICLSTKFWCWILNVYTVQVLRMRGSESVLSVHCVCFVNKILGDVRILFNRWLCIGNFYWSYLLRAVHGDHCITGNGPRAGISWGSMQINKQWLLHNNHLGPRLNKYDLCQEQAGFTSRAKDSLLG